VAVEDLQHVEGEQRDGRRDAEPVRVAVAAKQADAEAAGEMVRRARGDPWAPAQRGDHAAAGADPRLGSAMAAALSIVALVAALLALAGAVAAVRVARGSLRRRPNAPIPTDVQGLRGEVQALRVEVGDALRHLAVVRYDAFGDMGGLLSWSVALLDDGGSGVVLTSIHGRSDSRTYAKNVAAWTSDQKLSPEEDEAISLARG
jgi:hypothetical protein